MAEERIHLYDVLEPVPRGGPGGVFRACVAGDTGPFPVGTIVQIRVVSAAQAGGAGALDALRKEHVAARAISSQAVCAPADFGVCDGPQGPRFWSVCRWAGGRTLTEVLATAGSIPDPFVDAVAKQACAAVAAVHRAGLFAIGLSPDTLLVQDDTSVLLLDPGFGPVHAANRTQAGAAPAALACAAPETIRTRDRADERADLFSLGAALFRAMTGRWHRPDDAQALVCEPESFAARRPSDVHPRLSVFLDELVFALLQPDRARRFASFEHLAQILEERRDSSWWRGLHIAQETYVAASVPRARVAPEPPPPPIPVAVAAPDAVWIASRHRPGLRLARHAAPLAGREDELHGLVDAVSRMRDRGGQVRLIQAPAGTGKTRLVDALLDVVDGLPRADAPLVLLGEHRRLGIGRPMRAFTEALARAVADGRDVTPEQIAPLLGDAVAIAPAFAAFLSGQEPPAKSPPLTRDAISGAFARAFASLCSASPVVLVIENLQWADPEGLDLFAQIARLTWEMPLLLLATSQPAAKDTALAEALEALRPLDHVATTKIDPFDEDVTLRLVMSLVVPGESSVALARRIHESSAGVASRIVETVRLLDAEGVLSRDESGRLAATQRTASVPLPQSEDEIWTRRLARLGAAERAVLAMSAVQGFAFDPGVVRLALGLSQAEAERAFEGLAAASLVEGTGPARKFCGDSFFDHVHDALDDAAYAQCHEATATAFLASRNGDGLPPSETHGILSYRVAWHYLLAGKSAEGLLYVEPAMRHLRSTWRLGDAERLAALAGRTLANDPDRTADVLDMMLTRAEVLGHQGRHEDQREILGDALVRARRRNDAARESLALYESARLRFALGDLVNAGGEAREALAAAQRAGSDRVVTNCQGLLGAIAFRDLRYQEARNHVNEMLDTARRRCDLPAEAEALQTLGQISQSVGSFEHAEELHRTAMNIYRREGNLARESEALASLGNIASASGDLVKAEGFLRRAVAIARAVGDGQSEARVLGRLGMVLQEAQRFVEARATHVECLHVSRRIDARHNEVVALLNLATLDYVLGRLDDARSCYGDAMRAARGLRESRLMGYALTGLGEVSRQGGDFKVARGLFERAVTQFRRCDDEGGLAAALLGAGRVEVLGGDAARGQALLSEARDLAVTQNARYAGALSMAFLSLLQARRGAADDALAVIAEAGALIEGVRAGDAMRLELLFVHALVLRVIGRRVEGDRKMLQAETQLFQSTLEMSRDDRDRVCSVMSPHREILAGVAAARAGARTREKESSGTVAV